MTSPTWDSFEQVPLANYVFPTHQEGSQLGDEFGAPQVPELVLSTHRLTTAPVVLAGGQGVLPAGTVLGQRTSDGKHLVYKSTNSDGTQVPVGILRKSQDTGGSSSPSGLLSTDLVAIIVTGGVLRNNMVSGADANALTALKARIDNVTPTPRFIF